MSVTILGVKVSLEIEKAEDIVKDILKHHRNSHRPGIHQSVHLNKSIFCMLFFTLSRLKGPQKILVTIKGFGTLLCRQYQYSQLSSCRMREGMWEGAESQSSLLLSQLPCCYFYDAGGGLHNYNPWVRKWLERG